MAFGDTVYIVDPTPCYVVRVVPSLNSVMIHPAFGSRCRSFFVGFSALWAPPISLIQLAVNTDPIQECNLCSPVPPPVPPDAMDVSSITTPPLTFTVGSITDSVEPQEFAALLREADELERLEKQLKELSSQLDRQQERLAHMTTRVNQLLLENETLRRDLRNTQSRPEDMQKTWKSLKTTTALSACSSKSCLASLNLLTALPPKTVTTSLASALKHTRKQSADSIYNFNN